LSSYDVLSSSFSLDSEYGPFAVDDGGGIGGSGAGTAVAAAPDDWGAALCGAGFAAEAFCFLFCRSFGSSLIVKQYIYFAAEMFKSSAGILVYCDPNR
jgi:hypothetical protein